MQPTSFIFEPILKEALILKRRNRFIMEVEVDGTVYDCHCPTTGSIGNIVICNLPCLLSHSTDAKRKTRYTVEAISLDLPNAPHKTWIGINQNAANRYVEHFLVNGEFADMVGAENTVLREQRLGISKLDFLVGNTYLEVKTPLQGLQIDYPPHIRTNPLTKFNSTARFVKHVTELANSLQNHERAVLLTCFLYDNPGFQVIEKSIHYEEVKAAVDRSMEKGVELWQANFKVTPECVTLDRYHRLKL